MIQRAGAHVDQDFIAFGLRIGDLGVLEGFRSAVLFEDDCPHFERKLSQRQMRFTAVSGCKINS
jgi:hypothetical protein